MNINQWLKKQGMMQKEFARRINVSPVSVNYWIKGKRTPTYKSFLKIKEITNGEVTYEELLPQIQSKATNN